MRFSLFLCVMTASSFISNPLFLSSFSPSLPFLFNLWTPQGWKNKSALSPVKKDEEKKVRASFLFSCHLVIMQSYGAHMAATDALRAFNSNYQFLATRLSFFCLGEKKERNAASCCVRKKKNKTTVWFNLSISSPVVFCYVFLLVAISAPIARALHFM